MSDSGNGAGERPIGAIMHAVLRLLQTELRPLSNSEIRAKIGVDISTNEEVRENLKVNPKILREPDGRWRWKSKYYLRNRADLMALLRRAREPIVVAELFDAYKGVKDDIEDLMHTSPRQVIVIKQGNSGRAMLFNYEPRLYIHVSDDTKQRWAAVRVPDATDTHRFLVENSLKTGSMLLSTAATTYVRKRPKKADAKKSKRVKLTNVHMEGTGIDLTRDVDLGTGRPSAFKS